MTRRDTIRWDRCAKCCCGTCCIFLVWLPLCVLAVFWLFPRSQLLPPPPPPPPRGPPTLPGDVRPQLPQEESVEGDNLRRGMLLRHHWHHASLRPPSVSLFLPPDDEELECLLSAGRQRPDLLDAGLEIMAAAFHHGVPSITDAGQPSDRRRSPAPRDAEDAARLAAHMITGTWSHEEGCLSQAGGDLRAFLLARFVRPLVDPAPEVLPALALPAPAFSADTEVLREGLLRWRAVLRRAAIRLSRELVCATDLARPLQLCLHFNTTDASDHLFLHPHVEAVGGGTQQPPVTVRTARGSSLTLRASDVQRACLQTQAGPEGQPLPAEPFCVVSPQTVDLLLFWGDMTTGNLPARVAAEFHQAVRSAWKRKVKDEL